MCVPNYFVWTRHGTEAGQPVDDIFRRKESERGVNGGLFFWGVGNAVGPSILELLRKVDCPEVLFSPIRSAPRRQDVTPESVVEWTAALGLDGEPYQLPSMSMITSRFHVDRPRHYALVCYSDSPLGLSLGSTDSERVVPGELRNILTRRSLGASQVTAVVERWPGISGGAEYPVTLRAKLVPPYYIQLTVPKRITTGDGFDWAGRVAEVWSDRCGG